MKFAGIRRSLVVAAVGCSLSVVVGCSEHGIMNAGDESVLASRDYDRSGNQRLAQWDDGTAPTGKDKKASAGVFPQRDSKFMTYADSTYEYRGGTLKLANGSKFHVFDGSITPPPSVVHGDPVLVTMVVEKDTISNELIFTFGPSGTKFDPPAEIWLSYEEYAESIPQLYYIHKSGEYEPQSPDHIDVKGKRLLLRVGHFSRYAFAQSR